MDRANQVEAMGPEKKKADRREEIGDEAEGWINDAAQKE